MPVVLGNNGVYNGPSTLATSVAMTVPPGMSSGDVILAWLWKTNTATVTAPAGFTEVTGSPVSTTTSVQALHVFWKRITTVDVGTYNFSWSGMVTTESIASRYIGCVTDGDPIDFANLASRSTVDTASPSVSGTTTGADRLLVWHAANFSTSSWTQPPGYSLIINNQRMGGATLQKPAAGATGSVVGTAAVGARQCAALIALKPSVEPPPSRHVHQHALMRASYY